VFLEAAEIPHRLPVQLVSGHTVPDALQCLGNGHPNRGAHLFELWPHRLGLRSEERVVLHRVEGSSFPNWIGTEQTRHFHFDGANRLILEAESASGRYTLTWQRRSA
jgi:hypothetical protein